MYNIIGNFRNFLSGLSQCGFFINYIFIFIFTNFSHLSSSPKIKYLHLSSSLHIVLSTWLVCYRYVYVALSTMSSSAHYIKYNKIINKTTYSPVPVFFSNFPTQNVVVTASLPVYLHSYVLFLFYFYFYDSFTVPALNKVQ